MDNFVILTKTKEELEEWTIRFLKIVEKHNLCFKRLKCDFDMEEIPILGVIVGKGQVKIEQKKIKAIKRMEDTDKSQGCGELSWICKLLLTLYPKLQPYSKTVE